MEYYFIITIVVIALGFLFLALKKPFWALLILLFFLPFNAFFVTYLTFVFELGSKGRLVITLWKEWLIFALLIRVIWDYFKRKLSGSKKRRILPRKASSPSQFLPSLSAKNVLDCLKKIFYHSRKIQWFDWGILLLFVLSLLTIFWGETSPKAIIFGLRFNFQFFLLYFIVRLLKLNLKQAKIVVLTVLVSGIVVVIFGVLQSVVLPWNFLNSFGYSYLKSWEPGSPLQSSQIIAGTRSLSRIISTLSGPNQLGSYLSMIILLSFALIIFVKKTWQRVFLALFVLTAFIPFFRTYSRSAWLGLVAALLVFCFCFLFRLIKLKKKLKPDLGGALISIFVLIFFVVFTLVAIGSKPRNLFYILIHPVSSADHLQKMKYALHLISKYPFGQGLGAAGPAAQWTLGTKLAPVTESSYLQIGVETGIIALILFVGIIIGFIKNLYRTFLRGFFYPLLLSLFLLFFCIPLLTPLLY